MPALPRRSGGHGGRQFDRELCRSERRRSGSAAGDQPHLPQQRGWDQEFGPGLDIQLRHAMTVDLAATLPPGCLGMCSPTVPALTAASVVDVVQEDGSTVRSPRTPTAATPPPAIMHATLVHNANSTFTFVRRGSLSFTFADSGYAQLLTSVTMMVSPRRCLRRAGLLSTVTAASGRVLTFAHNPDHSIASVHRPPRQEDPVPRGCLRPGHGHRS